MHSWGVFWGKEVVRILGVAICDGFFKVWLLYGGKGGNLLMEFIVRVGVGLVVLLLSAV